MHATLKNNLTKLNPKISEVCQTTVKKLYQSLAETAALTVQQATPIHYIFIY